MTKNTASEFTAKAWQNINIKHSSMSGPEDVFVFSFIFPHLTAEVQLSCDCFCFDNIEISPTFRS